MKSWLPRFLPPAFALVLAAGLPFTRAQPPAPAAEAVKADAEKASPPALPAPEAPPPAAAETPPVEAPPLRTLAEPDRSPVDEIRARSEDLRRRAEDTRRRARQRADEERARDLARQAGRTGIDVVNVFNDSSLPAGDRADNVIAVFGSATSDGEVGNKVVAVFGDNRVTGPVGERVVAVFGDVTVDSHVGSVVAVFGDVTLGPKAEVDEEVVCVMGTVHRDPAAVVRHQVKNIGRSFAFGGGVGTWVRECALKGRLLAFNPRVGWAWIVAGSFLTLYLFLALLFRGGIEKCTTTLETRPGAAMLTAFGEVMLKPVVYVVLCITVVGAIVVPFLAIGLFFAELFGVAVMLAWLGGRLLKGIGLGGAHPVLGVLLGGALVLALYTVPGLGLLTYLVLGWLGLGVVLCTLFSSFSREKRVPAAVTFPVVASAAGPSAVGSAGWPGAGVAPMAAVGGVPIVGAPEVGGVPPPGFPPPVISAVTMPRAGFWIRFGAMWIDLFLLGVLATFMAGHGDLALFAIPAYTALLWKLKGTTVGGIVCNLKVVRLDGRELDWTAVIVRSLACFLSLAALGLGFIWVAIDDDRQSWHDKIAGTTVVRVPKGVLTL